MDRYTPEDKELIWQTENAMRMERYCDPKCKYMHFTALGQKCDKFNWPLKDGINNTILSFPYCDELRSWLLPKPTEHEWESNK